MGRKHQTQSVDNISDARKAKIRQVLAQRQRDFTLVLDNLRDPHNVAAIYRSCDAFGIYAIHLLYTYEELPDRISRNASGYANKWVEFTPHSDVEGMFHDLKSQGLQCIGTSFSKEARPLPEWDFTRPTAIILGHEHRGMSEAVLPHLDGQLFIPMMGMVQSFNVSVAAALILYEAWTQRFQAGMYTDPAFTPAELHALFLDWCSR